MAEIGGAVGRQLRSLAPHGLVYCCTEPKHCARHRQRQVAAADRFADRLSELLMRPALRPAVAEDRTAGAGVGRGPASGSAATIAVCTPDGGARSRRRCGRARRRAREHDRSSTSATMVGRTPVAHGRREPVRGRAVRHARRAGAEYGDPRVRHARSRAARRRAAHLARDVEGGIALAAFAAIRLPSSASADRQHACSPGRTVAQESEGIN